MSKWPHASEEDLSIIEVNECNAEGWQLATKRFRRIFNELFDRDERIKELEENLRLATVNNNILLRELEKHNG